MNLSIGLSGLRAAQRAIELVGTNLANAATEGYHRQNIMLTPMGTGNQTTLVSTGGVKILGSYRSYDMLVEQENLRVLPELGQIEEELSVLTSIEAMIGDIENDPLGQSLTNFFSALSDLTADPTQSAYAQDVVWSADGLCTNLRSLGDFLVEIREQLVEQARQYINQVNGYAQRIAELNQEIELAIRRGASPNLLRDQRDQAVAELAKLVEVQTSSLISEDGQVDVSAWGTPVVMGMEYQQFGVGVNSDGLLGFSVNELESYSPYVSGGKIGALVEMYNEIIPDMQRQLDTIARQIMWQFNNLHAQGVGAAGSFTDLTGVAVNGSLEFQYYQTPMSDGTVSLRLIAPDGTYEVYDLHISDTMTIDDVIDQINLISSGNLVADLSDQALYLRANNGYSFDFIPTYSDEASAMTETMSGRAVSELRDAYFTGDNALDELTFDLGSTPAEQFTYAIGVGDKTLHEVVEDINAWSEGVHAGWQAARAVWDDTAGGFVLRLESFDYMGVGNISVANVGNVKWSGTADDVAIGVGDFEQATARNAFSASVELRGIYTGENQTFTCRVVHPDGPGNAGMVGIEEDMTIEVYNEASELVKVLSVGLGYPAGEPLEIVNGIEMILGTGVLTHGEEFDFTARSISDDTMFLAAAGLNTFFQGTCAADIKVRSHFYENPELLASCRGVELSDNVNISMMLDLQSVANTAMNGLTPEEYYNNLITSLGQNVMLREARQESISAVHRELMNQRDQISGVDANEEAANLLVFERMFQSMSKFITTQNEMMQMLMDVL
ncbi:MAG: flagellar hook-associated protein FlgK [Phycisphaerae bacterium]|nr:flagellar hook-associated protein FlgK [Phycisphaerae bacterium]